MTVDQLLESAKARQKIAEKKLKDQEKGTDWGKVRRQLRTLKSADLVAFNELADEYFVHLVREILDEAPTGKVKTTEILRECSYEIGVSPETVKRYLLQHTARRAQFRVFQGYVFINPNYENRDDGEDVTVEVKKRRPRSTDGPTPTE